jgi:Gpi18-like mannosyltransferase
VGSQSSLDYRLMGTFESFTTKTHFNSLKRLVVLVGLAVLAAKLAVTAIWAAPAGSPLDLLARLAASVADLGAVLLVFEVLRSRRPANRAARSSVLLAVSPALFVASGIHGDPAGVAVALLLLGMYLLVDRQAPLAAGIAVGVAARVDPLVLVAAPVALAVTFPRRGSPDRHALQQFGGALVAALLAG